MATTPNYGFIMPDPTDFVTDLPADFEIFGDEVDLRVKALNPETTEGDLAYRGATADAKDRLAIGTAGQILAVNAGADAPEWITPAGLPITTEGDLIVGDATGVPIRLAVGAAGEVLTSDGDTVSFVAPSGAGSSYTLLNAGGTSLTGSSTTISGISGIEKLLIKVDGASATTTFRSFRLIINGDTSTAYDFGGGSVTGSSAYDPSIVAPFNGFGDNVPLGNMSGNAGSTIGASVSINGGTTTGGKQFISSFAGTATGASGHIMATVQGIYLGTAVISSIAITTNGTFDAGTVFVYGSAA